MAGWNKPWINFVSANPHQTQVASASQPPYDGVIDFEGDQLIDIPDTDITINSSHNEVQLVSIDDDIQIIADDDIEILPLDNDVQITSDNCVQIETDYQDNSGDVQVVPSDNDVLVTNCTDDIPSTSTNLDDIQIVHTNSTTKSIPNLKSNNDIECIHSDDELNVVFDKKLECSSYSTKSEVRQRWCVTCATHYTDTESVHVKSIAHQLNYHPTVIESVVPQFSIPTSNKGFQLLKKLGWDSKSGLGRNKSGRRYPIKSICKLDRSGFGLRREVARITHTIANKDTIRATVPYKSKPKRDNRQTELDETLGRGNLETPHFYSIRPAPNNIRRRISKPIRR